MDSERRSEIVVYTKCERVSVARAITYIIRYIIWYIETGREGPRGAQSAALNTVTSSLALSWSCGHRTLNAHPPSTVPSY